MDLGPIGNTLSSVGGAITGAVSGLGSIFGGAPIGGLSEEQMNQISQLSPTEQAALRENFQYIAMLREQAAQDPMQGPSAAQGVLQQGMDQNLRNSIATMRSARNMAPGAASRFAAQQGTQMNLQTAQQAAILRAQEQQAAQQRQMQLQQMLGGAIGQQFQMGGVPRQAMLGAYGIQQQAAQAGAQRQAAGIGALGSLAGAGLGLMAGGPMGAAVGAQMGGAITGGVVGGGSTAGWAPSQGYGTGSGFGTTPQLTLGNSGY